MLKKLIPFVCVFMYYASPYRLFGHVLPELLCLIAVIFQLVQTRKFYLPKEYNIFLAYMWIVPPIISLMVGLPGNYMTAIIPMGLILTSLNLAVLMPNVDAKLVIKYYKYLVYIAIGFFIIQEISVALIGWRPTAYIPFLDSYYNDANVQDFISSRSEMERSSSFFLEPSHFLQYIMPYVCIVACQCVPKRKISKELLLLLSVVLWAKSGSGYLILLFIGVYLFLISSKKNIIFKLSIVFGGILAYTLITTYLSDNVIVSEILRRTKEFSLEVDAHGQQSGFFRIWRGYFIYGSMDLLNQIFGASLGSVEYIASKVYILGINYEGTYMNGIQSLLITGGIVGTLLFFYYIVKLYKSLNNSGRCIIVAMIVLFFIENMLYSPKMFLYILLAFCISHSSHTKSIPQDK